MDGELFAISRNHVSDLPTVVIDRVLVTQVCIDAGYVYSPRNRYSRTPVGMTGRLCRGSYSSFADGILPAPWRIF